MLKKMIVFVFVVLFYLSANAFAVLSDTTDDGLGTISAFGENLPSNEVAAKAFDNSTATKWLDFKMKTIGYSWIQYQYASGKMVIVTGYTITSANDAQERDPMDWTLQGSNNGGASWVTLDTRTNVQFATRFLKQSFSFTNITAYNIYRLYISKVRNTTANSVQLAEIELLGSSPTAYNPNPAGNSADVSPNATLSWTAGEGAVSHDVYFGTTLNDVNNAERLLGDLNGDRIVDFKDILRLTGYWLLDPAGSEPYAGVDGDNIVDFLDYTLLAEDWKNIASPVFKGNRNTTSFNPGTLALSTTYYWRVDEVKGPNTAKGDIWSFTTASGKASNPNPANNATYVTINAMLSWSAGAGAASHNVYFGTVNPPPSIGNQSGTTYSPGTLTQSTTYYWRIDEVGSFGTIMGDVWSFTTTDSSYSLNGKIMCGYQGWFACPGDGWSSNWKHWSKNSGYFDYTDPKIEMWPDTTEYARKYEATGFASGSNHYYVFSSYDSNTTMVHFKWMQQYGIDGVFVQRFGTDFGSKSFLNTVLSNCKTAATAYGRKYAVMYDLTGYTTSSLVNNITSDWLNLETSLGISGPLDDAYIKHNGKPVIAIYGIFGTGVTDYPDPALCATLIQWFKDRSFTVLIGVNNDWRTRSSDTNFQTCVSKADIIMPWNVGRYSFTNVAGHCSGNWVPDMTYCNTNNKDYMICIFPGFSWHNWNPGSFNYIPRNGGQFLWDQVYLAKNVAGTNMIYVAMFDEVDESSAIFKVSSNPPPPSGNIQFLTCRQQDVLVPGSNPVSYTPTGDFLPSDEYLWLVGQATRGLRGEIPVTATRPVRP